MSKIAILLINIYQSIFSLDRGLFSLLVPGGACRYSPSCSQYMKDSITKYGPAKGLMFGVRRLLSCR